MSDLKLHTKVELLKLLQFSLKEDSYWTKTYEFSNKKYELKVRLPEGRIVFPEGLVVHNESTSKLNEDEDFVVLECVDRLLCKKYPAEKIELEKTWTLGRKEKGRLDVLVRCKENNDIYLMIECKTYDTIDSEIENTENDGGQLFSYFQQDRSAKFLCLYASWVEHFGVTYNCKLVPVQNKFLECRNVEEVHKCWGGSFMEDGVFEEGVLAYQVDPKP